MITRKQHMQLASAYSALSYAADNLSWTPYARRLKDECKKESKAHDGFRGPSIKRGMSMDDEAKYFAVKRFAEYALLDSPAPDPANIFSYQMSCFMAYAIAQMVPKYDYLQTLIANHADLLKEVASWDYCELIAE